LEGTEVTEDEIMFTNNFLRPLITDDQIKSFRIYFLEFEKHFSICLETYSKVYYQQLGYVICDFRGKICKKK
jgi:hypothetical protein